MRHSFLVASALAALAHTVSAVTGAAEGFAKGVTGGGSATPVYPKTNAELVSYLGDSQARVIYLDRTFDFTGTEGTAKETGCAPWGTASNCQTAINKNSWCDNYQPNAPKVTVNYDKAGILGITVKSNKSIIGVGSKGIIKGKGLRMVSGVKNIIIQNIHITNLNPQYVWGGDAITIDNADLIWIDHVTTSLIGRQHVVLGNNASNRVTISNCKFDGNTSWSATCDGYHYWGLYFTGSNDMITFKNNYITKMSGRSPKVAGNTLLHAVNNYWYDSGSGHAFEVDSGAQILVEGNVFQNIKTPAEADGGKMFSSPSTSANAVCSSSLGRVCQINGFGSSGSLSGTDSSFLANFKGKNIASAAAYSSTTVKNVPSTAGFGKI
ncbi:polysaccharide lyase family 1 protein [Canariomyces notabilis]|uniref:pectin lyase n=1 Tax=Canariomyces notabilis TaxID=2074819 RepID=A0AAN6T9R8_9PEZI|nr:polysaccharide lyase family 1 protein [Canariomyces arenarius]